MRILCPLTRILRPGACLAFLLAAGLHAGRPADADGPPPTGFAYGPPQQPAISPQAIDPQYGPPSPPPGNDVVPQAPVGATQTQNALQPKLEQDKDRQGEKSPEAEKKDEAEKKEDEKKEEETPKDFTVHAQTTVVAQGDPAFAARYSGPNSLNMAGERQETLNADLFVGMRLWQGAELHADALMWEGFGLSQTFGIEDFPSADAYKAGTSIPDFMLARLLVRQTFGFGGEQEDVPDGQLALAGKQDVSRLTLTVGRFGATDIFDNNAYAKDAHVQFLNWAVRYEHHVGLPGGPSRLHDRHRRRMERKGLDLAVRDLPDARRGERLHRRRPHFLLAERWHRWRVLADLGHGAGMGAALQDRRASRRDSPHGVAQLSRHGKLFSGHRSVARILPI